MDYRPTRYEAAWVAFTTTLTACVMVVIDYLPDVLSTAIATVASRIVEGDWTWGALGTAAVVGAAIGYLRRRKAERREWPVISNDGGER